ncbi:MAG: PAS domain S-box protein, partial [Pseudomonadota bacterium]
MALMALASDIVSAWIIIALACALIILAGILMRQRRELKEQNALLRAKESNLRAVMDNAPVEIFLKDADGRYLEINRQFERLLNVTNDEVRGLYPADIHDPGLAERTREHDLHVLRTGKVLVRDERTRTPEGERVLHTIKFPVRDTQGRITGLGAVISDITADVTARDRARQAEQRLVDAVDALPAGFVFVQPDGRVGMTNRLYQDMLAQLGVDPGSDQDFETLVRLLVRHGAVPEAEGREEDWIADRLAFHDRHGNEIEYQMPDGRWFKAYDRPTSDGGMVGIRVDITDLKRQQEILERAITDRDAAERRFHDIAQVSSDWFWEQDKDLRFTFISDGYIRATGGDISGRIGKTREELIDGDPLILESSDWDWLNRQTAAREAFQDFVYGVFDNPEKPIWVRINGSPIYDEA